jgi:hypothetical protein
MNLLKSKIIYTRYIALYCLVYICEMYKLTQLELLYLWLQLDFKNEIYMNKIIRHFLYILYGNSCICEIDKMYED